MQIPSEIKTLSDLLSSLPSIGPKLSNRLALYLSVTRKDLAKKLTESLAEVAANIRTCKNCGNVTTSEICEICADDQRDQHLILVVEDALDLFNFESTNDYKGLYHILGGVISPINGIGPKDLTIDKLIARIKDLDVKEVIFALNPNVEGDSTSLYLKNEIQNRYPEVKITRLAKGVPGGSDLEFASSQTLIDSMRSRVEL